MNNFIKQVIEEKFASKAQQRFFYAKANEKGKPKKEKNKWGKWAKENSDDTDYSKIPDKVEKEEEVDESVDKNGNILSFSEEQPPSLEYCFDTFGYISVAKKIKLLCEKLINLKNN